MINTSQFTGTEHHYRHWLGFTYTDGVKYVAEQAQAYWLLDLIFSWQPELQQRHGAEKVSFQVWELTKRQTDWLANCTDGNGGYLCSQILEHCSYPDDSVTMWHIDGTLILPSEY